MGRLDRPTARPSHVPRAAAARADHARTRLLADGHPEGARRKLLARTRTAAPVRRHPPTKVRSTSGGQVTGNAWTQGEPAGLECAAMAISWRLYSCDDHLDLWNLPRDVWEERLPGGLRERGPRV